MSGNLVLKKSIKINKANILENKNLKKRKLILKKRKSKYINNVAHTIDLFKK